MMNPLEENGNAQTIRDSSVAAGAMAKRIEDEFDSSGRVSVRRTPSLTGLAGAATWKGAGRRWRELPV